MARIFIVSLKPDAVSHPVSDPVSESETTTLKPSLGICCFRRNIRFFRPGFILPVSDPVSDPVSVQRPQRYIFFV